MARKPNVLLAVWAIGIGLLIQAQALPAKDPDKAVGSDADQTVSATPSGESAQQGSIFVAKSLHWGESSTAKPSQAGSNSDTKNLHWGESSLASRGDSATAGWGDSSTAAPAIPPPRREAFASGLERRCAAHRFTR